MREIDLHLKNHIISLK